MIRTRLAAAALLAITASTAIASPTTWHINQPWEFYTSSIPAQGNLVGSITFDRAVSEFYPASWSFTLQHHDPLFTAHYPLTITGTYPNISSYPSGWQFWGGPVVGDYIVVTVPPGSLNTLLDGGPAPLSFAAYEYVYRGVNSSTRIINGGSMSTIPAPAASALLVAGLRLATKRRRR